MIEEKLLDVFHLFGGDIFYGIGIFDMFVGLKEAIPLGLGLGQGSDFAAGCAGDVTFFAVFLEEEFPFFGISPLSGKGKADGKNGRDDKDGEGANRVHGKHPFVRYD